MKCTNCGYDIPQGMLYCKRCGEEVRIVPDYNPLDEMLTTQIRVSFDETASENMRNNTVNNPTSRHTAPNNRSYEEREARRRQAEKRRAIKRRKRRILLTVMTCTLFLFIGLTVLLYMTSYAGVVKKGNKALVSAKYTIAQECFEKAIQKKPEQVDAYVGLSQLYLAKGDISLAEKVYIDAIKEYPEHSDLHEKLISFYLENNQALKIPSLLANSDKKVRKDLSDYIIDKPEYSLEAGVIYDDVQQLTFSSEHGTIYYTLDGTEPTFSSTKYTGPIYLNEGETVVKAFAVNENGVPGLPESKTYVIELPIEDAPAISPSTGQYNEPMKIEIKVPDGYTAYYTMDGSTPTTASFKYSGPINMPENDTLFKAILVNANGRSSGVTTRNYILEITDEE